MEKKLKKFLITIGVALLLIGLGIVAWQLQQTLSIKFTYIGEESDGFIAVSDEKNVGYINTELEQVIDLKYPVLDSMKMDKEVDLSAFKVKDGLFPYTNSSNKFGLVNQNGKIIMKAKYDYINVISKDFIIVNDNGAYYFINSKGDLVCELSFQDVATIDNISNMFLVYNDDKVGLIDTNSNLLLECNYDNISILKGENNNIITATNGNTNEIYLYDKNSIRSLDEFNDLYAMYYINNDIYLTNFEGKYHIYNIETKSLKTLNNNYVAIEPYYNGIALAVNEDDLVGYIDENENVIIDYQYSFDTSTSFNQYNLAVVGKNDLVGVINTKMQEIIPFNYLEIEIVNDDRFIVLDKNNKMYIIDGSENKITTKDYDYIIDTEYSDIFLVSNTSNDNTLYGIIDSNGKEIVPVEYEEIKISNNYFILKQDNKYSIEKR